MKVIYGIGRLKTKYAKPVVAIGVFDGLHRGHQSLIRRMIKRSKVIGGTSMVMTFSPHPIHILKPSSYLPFLISLKHRLKLIEKLGVKVCIVIDFTKIFSNLDPNEFVKKYLVDSIQPHELFVGHDFHFGGHQIGDLHLLRKLGQRYHFKVHNIVSVKSGRQIISSTLIRKLVRQGRLREAQRFLGRPVSMLGRVMRGEGRGKILGFPTANINPLLEIIPPRGVYLVKVDVNQKTYHGIANVGLKPSFKRRYPHINVEVHIFNFHKNIYGQQIEVNFITKIRNEKKFSSNQLLIEQLKKDKKKARSLFKLIK